jgi:hypothetical protein
LGHSVILGKNSSARSRGFLLSSDMLHHAVWWDEPGATTFSVDPLKTEAACYSESLVPFSENKRFHIPEDSLQLWRSREQVPPKRWYLLTRLHEVMSQKTAIFSTIFNLQSDNSGYSTLYLKNYYYMVCSNKTQTCTR